MKIDTLSRIKAEQKKMQEYKIISYLYTRIIYILSSIAIQFCYFAGAQKWHVPNVIFTIVLFVIFTCNFYRSPFYNFYHV